MRDGGKAREGHYTLLVLEETDTYVAGVKTDDVPESAARTMRNSPEIFNEMTGGEAKQWLKDTAPNAYRSGWRKWTKRDTDYGVGARILKRYKIGDK